MKQANRKQKQRGFTLIELVVVIAILAILAAFALPRFAQLSEEAHRSNVKATAGALAAGVALAKAQWVTNGQGSSTAALEGFGDGDLNVSSRGWPVAYTGGYQGEDGSGGTTAGDANMNVDRCQQVWNGVLQSNAPTVDATSPDYVATAVDSVCTFTYQLDGTNAKQITYDASTGEINTVIVN